MMRIVLFAVPVALIASAATAATDRHITDAEIIEVANQTGYRRMELEPKVKSWSDDQMRSALIEAVRDQTKIIVQHGHGVFIEYTAPDGRLYMWYPANKNIVHGEWGLQTVKKKPRICFKYLNAYHGVTGKFEPKECIDQVQTLSQSFVIDRKNGDPFNLTSGSIPYPKSKTDIPAWPESAAATSVSPGNQP